MSILSVQGLTKRFGGLIAVGDVSFEVPEGGVTAVIGPNGAGKTTLFNMLSGFLLPTEGAVTFLGQAVTGLPVHRIAALGMVRTFQLVRLFGSLTVRENVEVGRHLKTRGGLLAAVLRPAWMREQERTVARWSSDALALVGLAEQADNPASTLPYGQQRLLEIARALAAEPRLLLLDEPAAGLDRAETDRLAEIIRAVAARGTTVLLIEHDMPLVMRIAQKVVVLDFGRCIAQGSPEAVQRDPMVLDAYLGGLETAHA